MKKARKLVFASLHYHSLTRPRHFRCAQFRERTSQFMLNVRFFSDFVTTNDFFEIKKPVWGIIVNRYFE